MARELILKLGKKITDRVDVKLGMTQLDETSPEYYGLASVVTDEMAELALAMKVRVPTTPAEIGKKVGKDPVYVEQLFDQMSMIGLLEYNWENADHHKQWTLPIFVPGSAELMNMNLQQVEGHPEIAQFFERMSFLPLTKITCMVPPGGAGVGMHVIPVEKAIPATNESVDVEHISHWLKKYEGHIGVGYCSCRNAMRIQGEGCGELQDEMCIAVGQFADYCLETGKGRSITYEEALEILQRAEDNGYVHQITNIDGEDKIFAICNCALGSCFALRTSQLFNTPNMSASAYRAHVDAEKCVACGKCAEVCPAGAAKLGQKLCTKTGPVVYPQQPLPDDNHWGEHMWSPNYKDDNQKQCHESGTAPCKTACPAHIAVQGYINLAAQGRYLDALKLIKQDNPFPAVCGSICNRRCEDACTRGDVDRAVAAKLGEQVGVDPVKFGMEVFLTRPSGSFTAAEMVGNDIKMFEPAGKKLLIGQYETVDKSRALGMIDEIREAMRAYAAEKGADGIVLCITDIMEEGSQVLLEGETEAAQKGLGIADEHDGVWMPGVLSRKKQVAAPIMAAC